MNKCLCKCIAPLSSYVKNGSVVRIFFLFFSLLMMQINLLKIPLMSSHHFYHCWSPTLSPICPKYIQHSVNKQVAVGFLKHSMRGIWRPIIHSGELTNALILFLCGFGNRQLRTRFCQVVVPVILVWCPLPGVRALLVRCHKNSPQRITRNHKNRHSYGCLHVSSDACCLMIKFISNGPMWTQ